MKRTPKLLIKTLLSLTVFFAVERFCHHQTRGFRPHKVLSNFSHDPRYDLSSLSEEQKLLANEILEQHFYFLGDGGQGYSFLSEDGRYVLKLFKLHHMRTAKVLSKLPLFGPLKTATNNFIDERERNHTKIFSSCKIAMEDFQEETGLIFLHLNTTSHEYPSVSITDAIGITHKIDLDKAAFALQKKATVAFTNLKQAMIHKDEAAIKEAISSFVSFVAKRCQKGIEDLDAGFKRNYGIINGQLIEIDVGSFTKNPSLRDPKQTKQEILKKTEGLRRSLATIYPEMIPFFEQSLKDVCRSSSE